MKTKSPLKMVALAAVMAACASAGVNAQTVQVVHTNSPTAPGSNAIVEVRFTASAATPVSSVVANWTIARPPVAGTNVTVTPGTLTNAAFIDCGGTAANSASGTGYSAQGADVVPPNNPIGTDGTAVTYCTYTIPIAAGATSVNNIPVAIEFARTSDGSLINANTTFNLTISGGGGGNTPPTLGYNPTTGTTITYPAGGAGPSITVTNAGGGAGSGAAATTTLTNCTITGGGAAFPTTNFNPNISAVGAGAPAPGSITLPNCTPQAAAQNATLTCVETRGAGAGINQTWPLTCPATAPVNTPPTLTYAPNFGSTINVPAGAGAQNTTIQVGCPTDGAACAGSGTGLAATARLEQIGITGFSPASLACQFVNEAGTVIGAGTGPLDFVAATADPGDLRCTCTNALSPQNYILTVQERIPANAANTVGRQWNVTCGAGGNCGTVSATPNSGTVNLNNGGAAVQVASATVAGITAGLSQTVSCTTSAAPAGSTFTVTTAPSPLTLSTGTTTGTVSATCTNTNTTAATVTLTCNTLCSAAGSTATQISQYTLSCPGQAGPPPTQNALPVPFASDAGKVLLAGLVMLLGLAVVGFRSRG